MPVIVEIDVSYYAIVLFCSIGIFSYYGLLYSIKQLLIKLFECPQVTDAITSPIGNMMGSHLVQSFGPSMAAANNNPEVQASMPALVMSNTMKTALSDLLLATVKKPEMEIHNTKMMAAAFGSDEMKEQFLNITNLAIQNELNLEELKKLIVNSLCDTKVHEGISDGVLDAFLLILKESRENDKWDPLRELFKHAVKEALSDTEIHQAFVTGSFGAVKGAILSAAQDEDIKKGIRDALQEILKNEGIHSALMKGAVDALIPNFDIAESVTNNVSLIKNKIFGGTESIPDQEAPSLSRFEISRQSLKTDRMMTNNMINNENNEQQIETLSTFIGKKIGLRNTYVSQKSSQSLIHRRSKSLGNFTHSNKPNLSHKEQSIYQPSELSNISSLYKECDDNNNTFFSDPVSPSINMYTSIDTIESSFGKIDTKIGSHSVSESSQKGSDFIGSTHDLIEDEPMSPNSTRSPISGSNRPSAESPTSPSPKMNEGTVTNEINSKSPGGVLDWAPQISWWGSSPTPTEGEVGSCSSVKINQEKQEKYFLDGNSKLPQDQEDVWSLSGKMVVDTIESLMTPKNFIQNLGTRSLPGLSKKDIITEDTDKDDIHSVGSSSPSPARGGRKKSMDSEGDLPIERLITDDVVDKEPQFGIDNRRGSTHGPRLPQADSSLKKILLQDDDPDIVISD